MAVSQRGALDVSAISLSGLCIVHCLAMPILASFLPALALVSEAEWIHKAAILVAAPVSLVAVVSVWGRTGGRGFAPSFAGLAVVGLGLLVAGAFVESFHDFETNLTVVGGCVLAGAHLWRLARGA